jgi:hypothetical protein
MFPTRSAQRLQIFIHDKFLSRVLISSEPPVPPWPAKLLARFPLLQHMAARVIGLGFRPERVRTPAA